MAHPRRRHRPVELPVAADRVASARPATAPPGPRARRVIAVFRDRRAGRLSPAGFGSPPAVDSRRVASRLHLRRAPTPKGPTMSTTALPTLPPDLLRRPVGGVTMRLTQYGYPGDPYSDSETRKGHGAYHSLVPNESVALTDGR
jgi:hypothetical protein